MYDVLVAGAGMAGCVAARAAAEKGKRVLLVEKRPQIGGNCYDCYDSYGVLIHPYGPHIFHTDREEVREFLSRFTGWKDFRHKVVARTGEGLIPVPFNLNTLHQVFGPEAERMERKLTEIFGEGSKVSILTLMKQDDPDLQRIGEYVYQNIYLKYTMKQWGKKPEELDPSVTSRVPVRIARDDGYFTNRYQGLPADGFTPMFQNMVQHPLITVWVNTAMEDVAEVRENRIWLQGEPFEGQVIFTGALDEFFGCRYGRLPYRTLEFEFLHQDVPDYQGHSVVNYTVSEKFTRITEFKHLTGQECPGTTICREYPKDYKGTEGEIPYYVIENEENRRLYSRYLQEAQKIQGVHVLGRLAEYKYYDMDAIAERALQLIRQLIS
ncbi:MAG TPA: UDP-galactopyranose mutase [Lachnospiraceae bacterium]|nr:UDP-galactopyranose mutase [Lachnospiraceae bacterium]